MDQRHQGRPVWPTLLAEGQPITHAGALLGLIFYSVVLSLLAGWVTAAVARARWSPALWALAVLQLTLGFVAQTSAWSLMPVWYDGDRREVARYVMPLERSEEVLSELKVCSSDPLSHHQCGVLP